MRVILTNVQYIDLISRPKKSKTALGGLKKGWKKAIEVTKKVPKATAPAPKTPAPVPRGRADSVSSMLSLCSVSRSTFATTSSARSSVVSLPTGEFDQEESPASLQAARAANEMADATAKVCHI